MDIMTFIPQGRENAIPRRELVEILHLPDRTVREMIEQARRQGHLIINDGSGVGYYTSEDPDELASQYRRNEHRALSILVQQKHLRKRMKELGVDITKKGI